MKDKAHRFIIGLAILVLLVVVLVAFLVVGSSPKPPPPLPNPNGYDSFVQAGALLSLNDVDFTELDQDALHEFIATKREALRLLRVGLTQQCAVPMDFRQTDYTNFSANLMKPLTDLKRLAHLVATEGRLAEMENHPADAARCYVDCIQFGNELSRGGVLINRLVGMACEAIGCRPLLALLPKLRTEELADLATRIDDIRRANVPWENVWRTERSLSSYARREYGVSPYWILAWWNIQPAKRKAQQKDSRIVAQLSLLSTDLALRCYLAENGRLPAQLRDLTPKFLKDIPPDPFTRKPLIYRPQGTHWLLYSVGPDGRDDGGTPITRGAVASVKVGLPFFSDTVPAGDVFYDSVW